MLALDSIRISLEPSFGVFSYSVFPLRDETVRSFAFELEHVVYFSSFAARIYQSLSYLSG